ncbi:MAG: hypothetical protein ACXVHI_07595 [Frankiaceae bacterium]
MTSAKRFRARGLVAWSGFAALLLGLTGAAGAEGPRPARPGGGADRGRDEARALGRELFAREWVPNDSRSHGGDGLGPVYNDRSCLACHHQGGPGGGGLVVLHKSSHAGEHFV